jgi:hypothetical protein
MECMTRYSVVSAIPDGPPSRRGVVNIMVRAWSVDSTFRQAPGSPTPPGSNGNMGDRGVPGLAGNNPDSLDPTMTTHRIVDVERTCRAFRVASSQKEGSS